MTAGTVSDTGRVSRRLLFACGHEAGPRRVRGKGRHLNEVCPDCKAGISNETLEPYTPDDDAAA